MRPATIALTLLVATGCATSHQSIQYAVVDRDSVTARDASVDSQRLAQLRQSIGRDFIWFERDGEYIVTDAVQVAVASRTIEPVRRVSEARKRREKRLEQSSMYQLAREWRDFGSPLAAGADDTFSLRSDARVLDQATETPREILDLERQQRRTAKKIDRAMAELLDQSLGDGTAQKLR
jgi:hypothetical protein